ncbi:DUF5984 family protein [Streptomyces sp. H27-G5]|uniref:DUF5984 family protein n=1 Tax=Streptomyces sp. H27-G5 TaxID=2996698 RepID=UPI002271EF45|nr:DUF5984 family protein [Streptomyces sp. H27-G5]MCY0918953.1 DUF5984 family protein [Streptomyces sp. H27-G5]
MIHTDSAIRFRFGLTPLEEVKPWGAGRVLHWFGLTAGWYCIDIDGHEVLRYSERTVRELRSDGDGDGDHDGDRAHPYVDHYVVRLWEDVIALVSGAMEPVPHDLVEVAADISPSWTWIDSPEADAALTWHGEGHLYTDYLRVAPAIRLWRTVVGDEDTVTIAWEHRADPEGVIEFASPQAGRVTVPTSEFLGAVAELDRSLLAAMDERISELEKSGPPPGVRGGVDVEQLRREQRDRATWLPRARDREPGTDWDAVRTGTRMLLAAGPEARDGTE